MLTPIRVEALGETPMTLEVRWTLAESATVTAGSAPGLESTPASGLSLVTARDLRMPGLPANVAQALENVAGAASVSEGQAAVPALRGAGRAGGRRSSSTARG